MARDLYDILEIPQSATPAWIKRSHALRRAAVEADSGMTAPQRALELQAIDAAFETLSHAGRREAYDRKLEERSHPPETRSRFAVLLSPGVLAFAFLCLVAAGVYYHGYNAQQTALRIERERIEADNARFAKEIALREEREQLAAQERAEARQRQQEQLQRSQTERERRELERWQRNTASDIVREQREQERADQRARAEADQAEYRDRRNQEERRLRAIQELERQKRFLRESERR